ncbi:MAG: enoyl-CoA hydratase/isomerase family protein [Limnochordaceae bacterium]|nr:enoyl-CoA hydratase/isomerase family protein [Limnochordaceae bacterium]
MVREGPDEAGVLRLTLSDPERRNPLTGEAAAALADALEQAEQVPAVRAILLTGSGEAFCAGADVREFAATGGRPAPEAFAGGEALVRLFKLGARLRRPLVAAVNGWALGGGLGLVALAHVAVASDRARFGATEVRLGMFPMVVMPALARAVGERRALELGLTGRLFDAQEAQAMGLVHRVVPHDRLPEEAGAVARQIAGWSPLAVEVGLRGWAESRDLPVGSAIEYLHALRLVLAGSDDFQEGVRAFLEKRAPQWKGR